MRLLQTLAKIIELQQAVFQTRDAVALLGQSTTSVSQSLSRLAYDKHLIHLYKGLWAFPEKIDPFMLPKYLTAPFPSYISLQSAFYYHGIIEQIPEVVYTVSIARTKRIATPIATFSIHHIPPDLFFGYQNIGNNDILMATPEKAIFDFLYLQPAKNRLFTSLPEISLPKKLDRKQILQWIDMVKSTTRKTMMLRQFAKILSNHLKLIGKI